MTTREAHIRHHDDEWIDEVRVTTVPRFKESELSGDEWRTSVRVQLLRKGVVLVDRDFGKLAEAMAFLPSMTIGACPASQPWPDDATPGFPYGDGVVCDQPGCVNPGTEKRTLIHRFARTYGVQLPEYDTAYYRVFCLDHADRGDCGLEDADENYVETATGAR